MAPKHFSSTLEPLSTSEAPLTASPTLSRKRSRSSGAEDQSAVLEQDGRIYEYTSAANPNVPQIPVAVFPPELHQSGPSRVIPFRLSDELRLPYNATSQNLLASYLRICAGEQVASSAVATSQAFYVIRGQGSSEGEFGPIEWSEGDLFVVPATSEELVHRATAESALYWVSDEPLMKYLGVAPNEKKFSPTLIKKERMMAEVEILKSDENAAHRNRLGILLGNKATESTTKTLTHTLWALLNTIRPNTHQRPHRHNSVALDFCVHAAPAGVYTLMGPELDEQGWVKNPVRMDWATAGAFTTPPGWWHSHHNESSEDAWVLPLQDAGLLTHQGILDIQFSK